MIDVVSICPFPATALLWEAEPGEASLTVVVKGTFSLVPGEVIIAAEQDPLREERHWDDNGLASIHFPGDFAPSKRRVDVTLVGHAYAPRGEPTTSLVARLAVGEMVKAVRVTGDRSWTMGASRLPEPGPPSPFLRMPLRYERAALSADNPIGIDVHAPPVVSMPALPNLEKAARGDGLPCFGPVAPTWRARRKLLDEAATFWAYGIARDSQSAAPPLGPAPRRVDFAFFNAAPADQQLDLLRPGTPLVLDHLHPRYERLETRLAAVRPQVFHVPPPDAVRGRVEEIVLRCDSLWIDTDRAVVVIVWRGVADVGTARHPRAPGRLVVAADPEGKKLRWDRVEKRLGEKSSPTLRLGADGLPPPEEPDPGPPPDPLAVRHDTVKGQRGADEPAAAPPAQGTDGLASAADTGIYDAPTNQMEGRREETRAPVTTGGAPPYPLPRPIAPARPPAGPPAAPPAGRQRASRSRPEEVVKLTAPPVAVEEETPLRTPPPRGMMVMGSPLGQPSAPPSSGALRLPKPTTMAGAPSVRAPGAARPGGLALRKDLTVQRYAEISAALAQKGVDRAAVLRAHLLTEAAWSLVEQTWKKAIAAEAAEGGRALAEDFDDAYVAHQERLLRPIDMAAYARLQVGVERSAVGQVLAELDLELGDLVRLQRVWERRVASSPDLHAALALALDEARRP